MKTSTILSLTGITVATGFIGYAFYFDYKRRNDAEFRRKIMRSKKKMSKISHEEGEKAKAQREEVLERGLAELKKEDLPKTPEQMEKFFLEQVSVGETLAAQGPEFYANSALAFYKALKVYPSPSELLPIYKQTQPPEVFELVMRCATKELESQVSGLNMSMRGQGVEADDGPLLEEVEGAAAAKKAAEGDDDEKKEDADKKEDENEEKDQDKQGQEQEPKPDQESNASPPPTSSQGSFVEVDHTSSNAPSVDENKQTTTAEPFD